MRQVIVGGGSSDPLNTAATEYIGIYKRQTHTWAAAEANRKQMIPGNGIMHSFKIILSASPGGTGSYIFTLRINGAATGQTVTVTAPNTSAEITTVETTLTQGAFWVLEAAPSGTPTAAPTVQWEFIVEDNVNRCMITGGHQNPLNATTTEFNALAGGDLWAVNTVGFNNFLSPLPVSGKFTNWFVELSGAPGAGTSYTIGLRSNALVILTTTISGTATTGNDTSLVTATEGEGIEIRSNPSSIPTVRFAWWGVCFEPDEPYFYPVLCGSTDIPATGEFNSLFSSGQVWGATESSFRVRVKMGAYKNLYMSTGTPPGVGQTATLTVYKNGIATSLSVTLSDTATLAGNTTFVLETVDDDELSIEYTQSVGAAVTDLGWSVAQFTYNPWMYSAREGNMGN